MRVSFRVGGLLDEVWIIGSTNTPLPDGAAHLSPAEACFRLDEWFGDEPRARCRLADVCASLGTALLLGSQRSPVEFKAEVRRAFESSALRAYRLPHRPVGGAVPRRPEEKPSEPPPAPKDKATSWIAIQLVDDSDPPVPVPFKKYRVELPDQAVREGMLDENGQVMLRGVDPGSCKVSFPQLHGDDWKPA
jgi:hypothetical protein